MINKLVKGPLTLFFPKYNKYAPKIFVNRIRKNITKLKKHQYLFILSPPYCGSTLMHQIISTSNSVSTNNNFNTREGQTLPTLRKIMFHDRKWDPEVDFDWEFIKKEWEKYWNLSYPILLEKSTPNIVRARSIEKVFIPSYFIIITRNPYAHSESLIKRNNSNPTDAAKFVIKCLKLQRLNLLNLKNSIHISYEFLTTEPEESVRLMNKFIPELGSLKVDKKFSSHNFLEKKLKIMNLNDLKIVNLTNSHLSLLNEIFEREKIIIDFFKYEIITNTCVEH